MSTEHFVVIGTGPAGSEAALTLREKAPEARITLTTKYPEAFYLPHLLPDYIAGKISEEGACSCSPSTYEKKDIRLRVGQEVVGLDIHKRHLTLAHKEILPFDGLVIAVGGKPRIPESLRVFEDLVFTLKTLQDARAWIERLSRVDSVLMLGGDLTSLAVTKALLHLGKRVFFVINEEAFWPLRFDQRIFEEVAEKLSEKGVEVLKSRKLKGIARIGQRAYKVDVEGHKVRVGMIGAFFGLVPDVRFLARSGLQMDRGILVNEYLNTGMNGIFATGDCAQIYHPGIRDYWISIGYENALALGRIAAQNLLGEKVWAEVPRESLFTVQGVRVNTSWWMDF